MLIKELLNEVFSALFDGAVSAFRQRWNEKKVKALISEGINRVIEDEKKNQYYDALDRAVYNSWVLLIRIFGKYPVTGKVHARLRILI